MMSSFRELTSDSVEKSPMLQCLFDWRPATPFSAIDQRLLRIIFRSDPQLARQKYLVSFECSNRREMWVYPFQAFLMRDGTNIDLLNETLQAYPDAIRERVIEGGWTPLHFASMRCTKLEVFQLLLDLRQGDLFVCDNNGMSPLHHLVCRCSCLDTELSDILCHVVVEIFAWYPESIRHKNRTEGESFDLLTFCLYVGAHEQVIWSIADFWNQPDEIIFPDEMYMRKFDISCGYRSLSRNLSSGVLMAIAILVRKSKSFRCMLDEDDEVLPLLEALLDSQCIQLEKFSLEFPQKCLTNQDLVSCMIDCVKSLESLQTFSIHLKGRSTQDNDLILEWISTALAPSIRNVTISNFRASRQGLGCLVRNKAIAKLSLESCLIDLDAAVEFGESLASATNLKSLEIKTGNTFSTVCINAILGGLTHAKALTTFCICSRVSTSDEFQFDPAAWGNLRRLETAVTHFLDDDYPARPVNLSKELSALLHANQNMTKFSCLYGNINLADLANVIATHAGLRELEMGISSHFDPQIQEPDSREFEDFNRIAEAMQGNRQIIKIGWAHSKHWWRVYFYLSRNRLNLTQVGTFNQSCFVTLFEECHTVEMDGNLCEEEESQVRLSLIYECCRQNPHLWCHSEQVAMACNDEQEHRTKRIRFVND